jgi:hypothetical protein
MNLRRIVVASFARPHGFAQNVGFGTHEMRSLQMFHTANLSTNVGADIIRPLDALNPSVSDAIYGVPTIRIIFTVQCRGRRPRRPAWFAHRRKLTAKSKRPRVSGVFCIEGWESINKFDVSCFSNTDYTLSTFFVKRQTGK